MKNLLRSDFYKLFKSKAFYICTLVAVVLSSGMIFLTDWAVHVSENMAVQEGESISSLIETETGITYGMSVLSNGFIQLFMAVFIAILITAEFSHGTMKNVISKGFLKYKVYASKVITMTIASFIMLFTMFVFCTASGVIVSGSLGEFTGTFVGQFFRILGMELLLHTALCSVLVMVAMVVRSSGGVIALNICIVTFSTLLFQLLEMLVKGKIQFLDYSVINNTYVMGNLVQKSGDILRAGLVAVAYLVITIALGIFAFNKSDIK